MPWLGSVMDNLISPQYSVAKTVEQDQHRHTYRLSSCLNRAARPMAEGCNVKVVYLPIAPLPTDRVFCALDVGGSLAKVVYVLPNKQGDNHAPHTSTAAEHADGGSRDVAVHMVTFDTERLDDCLTYVKRHVLSPPQKNGRQRGRVTVRATGVGCMKYRQKIEETLQVELHTDCDEMSHAAVGVDFLWRHLPPEQLLHEDSDITGINFQCPLGLSGVAPCLLVNLGSALTIVQLNADGSMKGIVGGSAQGGLTFLGLGALLTQAKSFEDLVELAERGDRRNLDLLVKDTAGAGYNLMPSDGMVSSFGKAAKQSSNSQGGSFREEDVASSLLYLITDQLAQTTYLVAKGQGIHRAVFCGSFLACNHTILHQIKYKLNVCSGFLQHNVQALFCNYENYLGAIGTFASHLNGATSSAATAATAASAAATATTSSTSSSSSHNHHHHHQHPHGDEDGQEDSAACNAPS